MSSTATHTGRPSRAARASSRSRVSSQARRLGRPVSWSVRARLSSRRRRAWRSSSTPSSSPMWPPTVRSAPITDGVAPAWLGAEELDDPHHVALARRGHADRAAQARHARRPGAEHRRIRGVVVDPHQLAALQRLAGQPGAGLQAKLAAEALELRRVHAPAGPSGRELQLAVVGQRPERADVPAHVLAEALQQGLERLPGRVGARHRRRHRLHGPQDLLAQAPLGDVVQEGVEGGGVGVAVVADRDLDRELVAVAVDRAQLGARVKDRALSGAQEALDAVPVGLAVALGHDRVGQRAAQHLVAGIPERPLRRLVPVDDPAGRVDRDERVVRGVQDRPGERRAGGAGVRALGPR